MQIKFLTCFFYLLLCISVHAQDSINHKHPFLKLSAISVLGGGGGSNLNYINNNKNQTYTSKQTLLSMWPAFASKPFYNYSQWIGNYNSSSGSNMLGAYVSFDNYSKKKNKYAIHSQTNVGITVVSLNSFYVMYSNIKANRLDTLYIKSGSSYYPQAYNDNVTISDANVTYKSTNVGIDVQQIFSTNQKKILSVFAGVGFTTNFSLVSQLNYLQYQQTGTNLTTNSISSYQIGTNYNLSNKTDSVKAQGTDKIKNSILYQLYVPFGLNMRLGKNDKKTISHIYLTTQVRIGLQALKIPDVNALIYTTRYITFGIKYKF
jgi:hypothetical protein